MSIEDHQALAAYWKGRAENTQQELEWLRAEIDTPHIGDFETAVRLEAAHQRMRWGAEHDAGKGAPDWFWLVGYLAGKALAAWKADDVEKMLHHIITVAAACANWHAHTSGADTRMRPGIAPDDADALTR